MLPVVSTIITGMANFSAQYNFQSIGLALIMMSQSVCTSDDGNCSSGTQAGWVEGAAEAAVFVGAVCGEITFGYLGDFLTRSSAMMLTMIIALFGTFVSSFLSLGTSTSVYATIIAFRFVLGVGLGGIFPLSATKAAEDAANVAGTVNSQASSWSFFWQLPALLGPWLLGYFFSFDHSLSVNYRWRLILGLGTIPSILTLVALAIEGHIIKAKSSTKTLGDIEVPGSTSNSISNNPGFANNHAIMDPNLPRSNLQSIDLDTRKSSNTFSASSCRPSLTIAAAAAAAAETAETSETAETAHKELSISEIYRLLATNPTIRMNLFASGSCWFAYDIVVYGLGLLSGYTIDAIDTDDGNVSSDKSVRELCSKQLIALVSTIPVTILSIKLVPILGLKYLQMLGFASVALLCLILASSFVALRNSNPNALFALYCVCYASLNFGVGITTFSMPAALFPKKIRATFNGLAAAIGKCGAVVSTFTFFNIAAEAGYPTLLAICTLIAMGGFLITFFFIDGEELLSERPTILDGLPNQTIFREQSMDQHSSFSSVSNPVARKPSTARKPSYKISDVIFRTNSEGSKTEEMTPEMVQSAMHPSDKR